MANSHVPLTIVPSGTGNLRGNLGLPLTDPAVMVAAAFDGGCTRSTSCVRGSPARTATTGTRSS